MQIAKVVNTLMRKKFEAQLDKKTLYERDYKLLNNTQIILFKELGHALGTSFEEINKRINDMIKEEEPLPVV